jgi:hypothetical protein
VLATETTLQQAGHDRHEVNCDTPAVVRGRREVEQVEFSGDKPAQIVAWMDRLAGAGDGWINVVPKMNEDDERPTSLGFFTLFGGGGLGVTMCTWIPAPGSERDSMHTSLGITHLTGQRAFARLTSLGVPVPPTWVVEQDHPRRGLVIRVPAEEPHDEVLTWAMRATAALSAPLRITGWRADIYLPTPS